MLEFVKTYQDENRASFNYYVEGSQDDRGTVDFDIANNEASVSALAPGDEFKWYANHLLVELESKAPDIPDSGTIMWY